MAGAGAFEQWEWESLIIRYLREQLQMLQIPPNQRQEVQGRVPWDLGFLVEQGLHWTRVVGGSGGVAKMFGALAENRVVGEVMSIASSGWSSSAKIGYHILVTFFSNGVYRVQDVCNTGTIGIESGTIGIESGTIGIELGTIGNHRCQ
jgi:hypothetical protein